MPSRLSALSYLLIAALAGLTLTFWHFRWDVGALTSLVERSVPSLGRFLPENKSGDPKVPVALAQVKSHRGRASRLSVWAKIELLVRLVREVEKRNVRDLQWMVLKSHRDPPGVYLVSFSWEVAGEREIFKWKADVNSHAVTPFNDRTRWLENIDEDFFTRFLTTSRGVAFRTEQVKGGSRPTGEPVGHPGGAPFRPVEPAKKPAPLKLRPVDGSTPARSAEPSGEPRAPAPGAAPAAPGSGDELSLQGVMVMGREYVGLLRHRGTTYVIYPGKLIGGGAVVRRINPDSVVIVRAGREELLPISAAPAGGVPGGEPPRPQAQARRRITLTPLADGPVGVPSGDLEPGYRPLYREPENRPPESRRPPPGGEPSAQNPRKGPAHRPAPASKGTAPHPLSGKKTASPAEKSPAPSPTETAPGAEETPPPPAPVEPPSSPGAPGSEASPADPDRIPPPEEEPTPKPPRRTPQPHASPRR